MKARLTKMELKMTEIQKCIKKYETIQSEMNNTLFVMLLIVLLVILIFLSIVSAQDILRFKMVRETLESLHAYLSHLLKLPNPNHMSG